ncbi:protein tyrosine phosphatase [Mesorhizobium sp. NBSH29]|uniref:tyrosine phosphatase family protein n=1 Tax=Mesorhizobium sp. NBSH29 TaxID=2654249 RepID=UPI00189653BC|nr:protein-tyrosine phosphatase family protein [Mesorhizobium sp. NBSH29]QPC86638.1 protein tyrosine phosphatase [Mesorhizobium sp. NBSH29]
MIHVCSLARLHATVEETRAARIVSLLTAGTEVVRPTSVAAADHLWLAMNDIVDEQPGLVSPAEAHVAQLLEFARSWDRQSPMVVHCYAGVSRSTAAAYIIAAALAPQRTEAELAATLRRLSTTATPNARLIGYADRLLGREGRMVAAIAGIGRGADCFEGVPFRLDLAPATDAD